MITRADLTPPRPEASLEVRLARCVLFVRTLVEQAVRGRPIRSVPVTPEVPEDRARVYGPLIAEKGRLVIEEFLRARNPLECQLVATAVASLRHTIETAAAVEEPVEPATAAVDATGER